MPSRGLILPLGLERPGDLGVGRSLKRHLDSMSQKRSAKYLSSSVGSPGGEGTRKGRTPPSLDGPSPVFAISG